MEFENYEKFNMLECYIESGKNSNNALTLYFNRYPERRQPSRKMFPRIESNLISFGSFQKPRPKSYYKENRELEEINTIGYVVADPTASSRKIRDAIGINRKKSKKILKRHNYRQYVYRKVHNLHPGDAERRITFCLWYLQQCEQDPDFCRKIIWTDEVRVTSDGIFNRHNNLYWSNGNPRLTINRVRQGKFGFNVWCGIYKNRILCHCEFDENLTAALYVNILEENLLNEIDNLPLREMNNLIFQQDGNSCHNALAARIFLDQHFPNKWIGTNGPVRWPARSPDLTPMDFFFWGFIKNETYRIKSNNLNELHMHFRNSLRKVRNVHIYNAVNGVAKRCRKCIENNGLQFEHLL